MSSGGGAGPLVPTFHGFVHNSMDGLVLFEACLSGKLHHVPRRPHDRERGSLIKSGSIFIYEENASGIKRWTDGVAWSPSRILGNFLIYRELEKPFPPGEKKRAMKRKRASLPGEPYPRRDSDDNDNTELSAAPSTPPTPPTAGGEVKSDGGSENDQDKDLERSLIGSLVDSYGFRGDGLVKKTMSISVNGISHHMVSYYKVDDVKNNLLPRPLSDHRLSGISVRPELYLKQNFRAPVEETEQYAIDGQMHAHPGVVYQHMPNGGYGIRPGQYFAPGQQQYSMYPIQTSGPGMYSSGPAWSAQPASAPAAPYGSHPSYAGQPQQHHYAGYYKNGESGAPAVKHEGGQPAGQPPYGGQYGSPYSAMPRSATQSTPNMAQQPYHTPSQPSSATFSRPPYSANDIHSPSTNGQPGHPMYASAPPQQQQSYAVRSPTGAPVSHSPHPSVKSPLSATPHSATPNEGNSGMPYRSSAYAPPTPQSGHPNSGSDMNGLGISGGPSYGAPSAHTAAAYQPQYAQ